MCNLSDEEKQIRILYEEVKQLGYNPVEIFLASISDLKSKIRRNGIRSCLSCESQELCEGKDSAVHFAQSVSIHSDSPGLSDYQTLIFSIASERCGGFSPIKDEIFTGN